jgi:hypothetical protein
MGESGIAHSAVAAAVFGGSFGFVVADVGGLVCIFNTVRVGELAIDLRK